MENEIKIGDIVYTTSYNVFEKEFNEVGGLTGKLLEIKNDCGANYSVEVDMLKYPFYQGSRSLEKNKKYVLCTEVTKVKNNVQQFKTFI